MSISKENLELKNRIFDLERRIEDMHLDFQKYCQGIETRMPDWEQLQRELLQFSKRKIYDMVLSRQMDRVLYKFQNRKNIWRRWVEKLQTASRTKDEGETTVPMGGKDP
jgi:hypothetical protein